jgi:hypothetical protein
MTPLDELATGLLIAAAFRTLTRGWPTTKQLDAAVAVVCSVPKEMSERLGVLPQMLDQGEFS